MRSRFVTEVLRFDWTKVLHVGSRGAREQFGPQVVVTGFDIQAGEGVDVVGDVHQASQIFQPGEFDAVYCTSTLEHLRRPWIAARELALVTRRGGWLFCQTHQSFPLHSYPSDYFRFSTEALREIFASDAGWRVIDAEYEFPCQVIPASNAFPHAKDWNFEAPAWLNVVCIAERL